MNVDVLISLFDLIKRATTSYAIHCYKVTFQELKNDIERVECHCGADAANKLAKELDRMTRAKCEGNKMKFLGAGMGGAALSGVASNMINRRK